MDPNHTGIKTQLLNFITFTPQCELILTAGEINFSIWFNYVCNQRELVLTAGETNLLFLRQMYSWPHIYMCLTSVTRVKYGIRSTLCWKTWNISGFTELSLIVILDYGLKLPKLSIHTLVMLEKGLEIH